MRGLYTYIVLTVILIILLISFAFLFFEKEQHQSLFYVVEKDGEKTAHIKVDCYKTEEKVVYKSARFSPKNPARSGISTKLMFKKREFFMEGFIKEASNFGKMVESLIVKNNGRSSECLNVVQSKFSAISEIAHAADTCVFDDESPVTYIPFLERYDYSLGGSQSFNALYHALGLLPPGRMRLVFTSTRDEYITVGGKEVKTEYIVVRAKALPVSNVWVSKKDRSIMRLEIKNKGLVIRRVMIAPRFEDAPKTAESELYDSKSVLFPSGDIALAGTLSVPPKEGKLPGVLLVAPAGPYNRNYAGIYLGISDALARAGYAVLRYDKRGMGESQGDNLSVSLTDETDDIKNALNFLANRDRVDKERLFIIAHGEGCTYLAGLDFDALPVKGIAMLSPTRPAYLLDFQSEYVNNRVKLMSAMDKQYPDTLNLAEKETLEMVKNAKKDYAFAQRRRVFTKRMAQLLELNPLESLKKIKSPVLVVCGRKDEFGALDYTKSIEKNFAETGFGKFKSLSFRDLGHFLGSAARTPGGAGFYSVDPEVLETIKIWFDGICRLEKPPEAPADASGEKTEGSLPNLTNP